MAVVEAYSGYQTIIHGLVSKTWTMRWGVGPGVAGPADGDGATFTVPAGFSQQAETPTEMVDTQEQTSKTGDTLKVVGKLTCPAGATRSITNVALYEAATGKLAVHADFPAIPLAAGDWIQFTFLRQVKAVTG
jgi:hypothetical protein